MFAIVNSFPVLSQNTLRTIDAPWSGSKICVARTVENFITILEMSSSNFESEMKKVGAAVKTGQDYCIEASEQFGNGATLDSPALIFNKCDDYLSVDWYGSPSAPSVFKDFMNDIKDHYMQTKEGMRYYGLKYNGTDYTFRFRRVQEKNTMLEFMTVWKVKK